MALTVKEKFENKRNLYGNAMLYIKKIKENSYIKDEPVIQKIFDVIQTNGNIINSSWNQTKATNSEEVLLDNWRDLKRIMKPIPIKDDRVSYMKDFFERMPEDIVKSEGYKSLYEACMDSFVSSKLQQVYGWKEKENRLEKWKKSLEEKAASLNVKLTYDSINRERDKISKELDDIKIALSARKDENQKKFPNVTKKDQVDKNLKRIELNQLLREFYELHDEVDALKAEMKPETLRAAVKEKANMFYTQIDCRSAEHENSQEYEEMKNALKIVTYWNTREIKEELAEMEDAPQTIEKAVENLKKAADRYLEVKGKQFRPFPSALRQSRLAMAQSISKFAEESIEQRQLLPSQKVVEQKQAANEVTVQQNQPNNDQLII